MGGQEAAWGWWRSSSLASLASPAGQVAGARRKPSFPSVRAFSSLQNLASEWCRRAKSGDLEKPFLENRKLKKQRNGGNDQYVYKAWEVFWLSFIFGRLEMAWMAFHMQCVHRLLQRGARRRKTKIG